MAVQSHRRDLEKENFWRWIFQEQKASQLNIRQFCKEHDLPESAFYHWRREIQTPSGFTIRLDTSIDRRTTGAILTEIDQLGRHQTAEVS